MIILEFKNHKGIIEKDHLWSIFKNYSKGYIYERIKALKYSGLIIERTETYQLTNKGWE